MSPALEQRLARQLRQIEPLSLEAAAERPPAPATEAAPELLARRAASQPAFGERVALSVADLRARVLANNLDLQVQLVDPQLARTQITEAEAKFDATIFAKATLARQDLPKIDDELVPLTRDAQQNRLFKYEAGIEVPLITGGKAKVSAPFDKKSLDDPTKMNQYLAAANFSLSQPLLRDAGVNVNVAAIRLARYAAAAVDTRTQLSAIRILAAAEKRYWKSYGAWRELEIRQEQYELASKNLEFVRRLVEEGAKATIEVPRAEVGVVERLDKLIIAETDLRLAQRDLKRVLNQDGLDLNSDALVVPTTPPGLLGFEFDAEELAARAQDNRLELLELELRLAADAVNVEYARNQTMPLFVLDYEYSFLNRGNSFTGAFEEMVQGERGGWAVTLRGEIPVTNELRRSRFRRALLTRLQRLSSRAQRELAIRQEVLDSLDVLRQNWQRILVARQNVIVARVNYDAEQRQFEEGARTQTEVLETLTRLGDAQSREVKAIVDYQFAQIDLAFATGTLLGYSRVGLEPIYVPLREDGAEILRNN